MSLIWSLMAGVECSEGAVLVVALSMDGVSWVLFEAILTLLRSRKEGIALELVLSL